MTTNDTNSNQFSELVADRMKELGLEIRDLKELVGITYEHARRIVRGEAAPSKLLMKEICHVLKLDYKVAEKLSLSDKLAAEHGDVLFELAGKKPGMQPIERAWDHLTKDQQKSVVTMVTAWANANKNDRVAT